MNAHVAQSVIEFITWTLVGFHGFAWWLCRPVKDPSSALSLRRPDRTRSKPHRQTRVADETLAA